MSEWKETEIGLIPKDWEVTSVDDSKELTNRAIISGPFGSNISSKYFVESGIPVIRGNNLTIGKEKFADYGFVFITQQKADELNTWALKDDLVFTAAGTLGQVGIIQNNKKYIISNKQLRLRLNKKNVLPLFAYYWFITPKMTKLIISRDTGSTIPLINLSVLRSLPIPLPKYNEQVAISNFILTLDDKIDLLRRQNETLEKIAQTLFKRWFVDFEFPDEEGKPYKSSGGKMVHSELGEIPYGCEVGTLEEIAVFKNGKTPPERIEQSKIPIYGSNGIIGYTDEYYCDDETIIIGRVGSYCGSLYYSNDKCWVTDNAIIGKSKERNYRKFLFNFLLKSKLNKRSTGSGQPLLNQEILNSIELVIPKEKNLFLFEEVISTLYNKKFENIEQIDSLTKIRDSLLPKLMSGKIRVKE